jgi:hypothetical protein
MILQHHFPRFAICAVLVGVQAPALARCPEANAVKFVPASASAVAREDPSLPRVLLMGDSISHGYSVPVAEALAGKAMVYAEDARGTKFALEYVDEWLGGGRWEVIVFNWGMHDIWGVRDPTSSQRYLTRLEQYEGNLRKLVDRLQKTKAKLIWCSTTPVPPGADNRRTEDPAFFNAAARKAMDEKGVVITDLYTFALPRLGEIQVPGDVHFTRDGYKVLAGAVTAAIVKALKKPASVK